MSPDNDGHRGELFVQKLVFGLGAVFTGFVDFHSKNPAFHMGNPGIGPECPLMMTTLRGGLLVEKSV